MATRRHGPRGRHALVAAVVAALAAATSGAILVAGPSSAWAGAPELPLPTSELSLRPARVEDGGTQVLVSASFPDLFDAELAERLDSGFAMTLVVRAYLVRAGADRAEALAVRSYRVAWDLWDEVYLVEERDQAGMRRARLRTRKEAIARVTTLERLPVAEAAFMPAGERWEIAVLVEVNPVSPETLAQVRRWLTRPQGGHHIGDGESLFGSLVSIFVNPRVGDAEKVLSFRVAPFRREGLPRAPRPATASPATGTGGTTGGAMGQNATPPNGGGGAP